MADQDIEECENMAKTAGADQQSGGAGELATGTAVGAGVGAATGAVVGLLGAIFGRRSVPGATYINFVDRCLREKGYEPTGWQ